MHPLHGFWPLYGLRLINGALELRLPDEADLAALAELARRGVHDPDEMPFSTPWTDAPPEKRARATVQWQWRQRAAWTPADWHLELVAVEGGRVVGSQGLFAKDFAVTRQVDTGSWVGRELHGRGIATRMRQAVLHLAFAGLGASVARSGAFSDNHASLRVSEKLGYVSDGTETFARRGAPATMVRLALTRQAWDSAPRPPVRIEGLDGCIGDFGLTTHAVHGPLTPF